VGALGSDNELERGKVNMIKRLLDYHQLKAKFDRNVIFIISLLLSTSLVACSQGEKLTPIPLPPITSAPDLTATYPRTHTTGLPIIEPQIPTGTSTHIPNPTIASYVWDGLAAYWSLEGKDSTRKWEDITGQGNDLNEMRVPHTIQGKIGNALNLVSSQGQYLEQLDSKLNVDTDFTWAGWIFPTSNTDNYILSKHKSGKGAMLSMRSGKIRFRVYGSGSEDQLESEFVNNYAWHFVCASYSSNNHRIDLQVDKAAKSHSLDIAIEDPGGPIAIGVNTDRYIGFWDGYIDEFGWWDRALDPEECSQLYNDGIGLPMTDSD
jgi:hypothetical protein